LDRSIYPVDYSQDDDDCGTVGTASVMGRVRHRIRESFRKRSGRRKGKGEGGDDTVIGRTVGGEDKIER
jgi:hypothetical protein